MLSTPPFHLNNIDSFLVQSSPRSPLARCPPLPKLNFGPIFNQRNIFSILILGKIVQICKMGSGELNRYFIVFFVNFQKKKKKKTKNTTFVFINKCYKMWYHRVKSNLHQKSKNDCAVGGKRKSIDFTKNIDFVISKTPL